MGGQNAAARLKGEGLDVSKTDTLTANVWDIFFPPREGHPLSRVWHPRSTLDASDQGIAHLRDLIVKDGEIIEPILVREDVIRDGDKRKKVFTCVDGAGRTIAGRLAEPILQKQGRCTKGMRCKIRLFVGSDADLLLARQAADVQPGKRPHGPAHLAEMTAQYLREGGDFDAWMKVMPAYVRDSRLTVRDVQAFERWGNLHPLVALSLDTGVMQGLGGERIEVPFSLFRAVLDEPRDEQPAALLKFCQAGVTHVKGATKLRNIEARAKANAEAVEREVPTSDLPKLAARAAQMNDRRPHPKEMKRALDGAKGLGLIDETGEALNIASMPADEALRTGIAEGFMLGVRYALGEKIETLALPENLLHYVKAAIRPEKGATK